jgi:transposase-like protein
MALWPSKVGTRGRRLWTNERTAAIVKVGFAAMDSVHAAAPQHGNSSWQMFGWLYEA